MTSKLMFQIVLGGMAIVPLATGIPVLLRGLPHSFSSDPNYPKLDSAHRFNATIWSVMGIACYLMIPNIESQGFMFRILMAAIFCGGFARLLSVWKGKYSIQPWLMGPLFAELVMAPILLFWQMHIASRGY